MPNPNPPTPTDPDARLAEDIEHRVLYGIYLVNDGTPHGTVGITRGQFLDLCRADADERARLRAAWRDEAQR